MKELLCSRDSTILDVMRTIDRGGMRISFIVDGKGCLLGTVTDGDIRRSIIGGKNLDAPVSELLGGDYVFASVETPVEELVKLVDQRINIIPLVDGAGRPVDYFEYKAAFHAPIASPELGGNELAYVAECITTNWISSQGRFVGKFEEDMASYCGVERGVAVMNGTVALHLALTALGIGKGDEVIVPDLTFAATINAVLYTGATPVIVDIEEESWCIDPECVRKAVTDKTKAVIPVHLYGQPCDMDGIMSVADEFGIYVVEDCAEAHGAEYDGKKVGGFGDISCFSFFGNKIITTGEGGMCLTSDQRLAERMRVLRDHGMNPKNRYWHDEVGYNYRMTNMQAAVGVAQLERIEEVLKSRDDLEAFYREGLKEAAGLVPQRNDLARRRKVCWLVSYVFKDESIKRDDFEALLKKEGVDARPFFHPLSSMPIYSRYEREPCGISRSIASRGVNFPTFISNSSMLEQTVDKISNCLSLSINEA